MFTDGTNNLLFSSWRSIDQRQNTAHLTCPVFQRSIKVCFLPGKREGDQTSFLISLFPRSKSNSCLTHVTITYPICVLPFVATIFSELSEQLCLLFFSVLDYLLLVCPATSITIQKTSARPLQRIYFFNFSNAKAAQHFYIRSIFDRK